MLTLTQLAEYEAAAALGALLMDDKAPGWARRVDPDTLRMQSVTDCVVGQGVPLPRRRLLVGSGYSAKLAVLGIGMTDQFRYGFALPLPDYRYGEAWAALGDAWRKQIHARTETATTIDPANAEEPLVLV